MARSGRDDDGCDQLRSTRMRRVWNVGETGSGVVDGDAEEKRGESGPLLRLLQLLTGCAEERTSKRESVGCP